MCMFFHGNLGHDNSTTRVSRRLRRQKQHGDPQDGARDGGHIPGMSCRLFLDHCDRRIRIQRPRNMWRLVVVYDHPPHTSIPHPSCIRCFFFFQDRPLARTSLVTIMPCSRLRAQALMVLRFGLNTKIIKKKQRSKAPRCACSSMEYYIVVYAILAVHISRRE